MTAPAATKIRLTPSAAGLRIGCTRAPSTRLSKSTARHRIRHHIPIESCQPAAVAVEIIPPLTMQQKQSPCQSYPRAFTTTSVTGFLHFLHLGLYRFVWHPTHHAYPSFSTKGVVESKGCETLSVFGPERARDATYIAALSAKEMPNVPFRATCDHDLSFNWSLAALASWAEGLVEIEVAKEAQ